MDGGRFSIGSPESSKNKENEKEVEMQNISTKYRNSDIKS